MTMIRGGFAYVILALAVSAVVPFCSVSADPEGVAGCQGGASIVFHASHRTFNDETIAVDQERIEERASSHGLDFGIVVGADAHTAWRVDENGVGSTGSENVRRDLMTMRAVLCGDVQSSGAVPGGWPVLVQRTPGAGPVVSVRYEENGSTQVIDLEHYGHLPNGTAVPIVWRVDSDPPVVVSRTEIIDRPVSALPAAWRATPVDVRPGTFPLREVDGRFALDASVNDRPIRCMIDTGSNILAVSNDLAPLIDPRDAVRTPAYKIGGYVTLVQGRVESLIVAGTSFKEPVVYVDTHLPPRTALCGADYLSKVRLRLDFGLRRATVSVGGGYACTHGCVPIDRSGVANGNATIGSRVFPVLYDSGAAGSIRMPPALVLAIRHFATADSSEYCGVRLVAAQVSFGGAERIANICPALEDARIPIAVGAGAFAAYEAVVIDYPDHLLEFVP